LQELQCLESRKRSIQGQLDEAADTLNDGSDVGKAIEYERRASELRTAIEQVEQQLSHMERHPDVLKLRKSQHEKELLGRKEAAHHRLMLMSQQEMRVPLIEANIFVSSPKRQVCHDCRNFVDKVNVHFGPSIELHECTK